MITEGPIKVLLDDSIVGDDGRDSETAEDGENLDPTTHQHYPGSTFPMKVTELIPNGELLSMLTRYRDAYEEEDRGGQQWRAKHDKGRQ